MTIDSVTQEQAEALAQEHVNLAHSVVNWFGFNRRQEVTWGPDYNQAARDIYERACRIVGLPPHPAE